MRDLHSRMLKADPRLCRWFSAVEEAAAVVVKKLGTKHMPAVLAED